MENCQIFKFQKFVKNRKKRFFSSLTKNSGPTFALSKRKPSWLFFEIGLENGFLGGINEKSKKKNIFFGVKPP